MGRARLGLVILLCSCLASACQRGPAHAPVGPGEPRAGADAVGEDVELTLAIIAVPQRAVPLDPWAWSFDPSGRFVAAEFDDDQAGGCGVWELESGLLVRSHDDPLRNPCVDWGHGHELAWEPARASADGQLHAEVRPGELEIGAVGGATRVVPDCASCAELLAWAPSGHRLATCDGQRLELWDADSGRQIRSEALGVDGETHSLIMRWTPEGLVVAAVHRVTRDSVEFDGFDGEPGHEDGEDGPIAGYALSSFWWPTPGDLPKAQIEVYRSRTPFDYYGDPSGRWLIFADPSSLHVMGTMARSSRLGRSATTAPPVASAPQYQGGFWRVDGATQWLESYGEETRNEYLVHDLELGWRATVAEPNPGVYHGVVFQGRGFAVAGELEPIAAASGVAVARWQGCAAYDDGDRCESGTLGWAGADADVLLDVAPQLSLALVERDGGLQLVEAQAAGANFSALPYAVDSSWRWGRGTWLALHEPGGALGVIDLGSGRVVYERDQVIALPEVPLAAQHDLLAIEYADRLELVIGPTGAQRIELAGAGKRVALSPEGERLAVLDGGQIAVLELASGATITSFAVAAAAGLAWRQDGAVLFYGDQWPTHAADPETGALLGALDHPALDYIVPGAIDPSWRWIHHNDGSFTRTLDFARIEIGRSWARTDSGLFEGALADLPERVRGGRFRIGEDADGVPVYTADDLEPWLARAGLVRGFFAGEGLPAPRIPADKAAKLAAAR